MKLFIKLLVTICILGALKPEPIFAAAENKLGIHILETEELGEVSKLFPDGGYITVPVRLDQLEASKWQKFFDESDKFRFIPIIRFATSHNGKYWERPTKRDIVNFADFFSKLDWHRQELIVIAFNEPNHAPEWGGKVDPDNYGQSLTFLVNWFATEPKKYLVLPAALDAAASNTDTTMSSNLFLDKLLSKFPATINSLSGWNSHAYPNPGFTGRPVDYHKMSVRSYQFELETIKKRIGKDLSVYITETGWDNTKKNDSLIAGYFKFAYENIWYPDRKVAAVTPFLFNAQTMPFSAFSLLDDNEKPTMVYEMIQKLGKEL
ncbi:hypothetical protein HZB78_01105 [Candidatus Collierbacteria bacterium]|nr:hypothetical protein [Candidatus Collierbacteria bacterium]